MNKIFLLLLAIGISSPYIKANSYMDMPNIDMGMPKNQDESQKFYTGGTPDFDETTGRYKSPPFVPNNVNNAAQ